jgi:hypothetical protein
MNVDIKPLVWQREGPSHIAITPIGWMHVGRATGDAIGYDFYTEGYRGPLRSSVYDAKMDAERWYTAKILDCLNPKDELTACQFVTMYSQCNREID